VHLHLQYSFSHYAHVDYGVYNSNNENKDEGFRAFPSRRQMLFRSEEQSTSHGMSSGLSMRLSGYNIVYMSTVHSS
jgi:hypothetical protein